MRRVQEILDIMNNTYEPATSWTGSGKHCLVEVYETSTLPHFIALKSSPYTQSSLANIQFIFNDEGLVFSYSGIAYDKSAVQGAEGRVEFWMKDIETKLGTFTACTIEAALYCLTAKASSPSIGTSSSFPKAATRFGSALPACRHSESVKKCNWGFIVCHHDNTSKYHDTTK